MKKKTEDPNKDVVCSEQQMDALKRSVASYKSANKRLSNLLNIRYSRLKELESRCDSLETELNKKKSTIEGLEAQVRELGLKISEKDAEIKNLNDEILVTETNIEHFNSLPWYKKMFAKM